MKRFAFLLILVTVAFAPWSKAWATPAFARSTNQPCTQCHIAFPKLTPYGMVFKLSGYRTETYEGGSIWDLKSLPIGGTVEVDYINDKTKDNHSNPAGNPRTQESTIKLEAVEFFSGGPLSNRFSYFLDFGSEEGGPFEPGATFLLVNDLLPETQLNLKVGVYDQEFFYLSTPRRLTLREYLAPVSMDATGIEAYGYLPFGLQYAAGYGNDETDLTKMTGTKEISHPQPGAAYGWATYSLANQTIGVRYYSAKADTCAGPDPMDSSLCLSGYNTRNHTQLDGNLDLWLGPINAVLAYYQQNGIEGEKDLKRKNTLGELLYALPISEHAQTVFTARYEIQDTDDPAVNENKKDNLLVLSIGYYPIENLRFVAEYSKLTGNESGTDDTLYQLAANFGF